MSVTIDAGVIAADGAVVRRLLKRGTERSFAPGDLLMREGEASASLFYVISGRVAVERSSSELTNPVRLAEVGDGQLLGEMGVLDGRPRSASARAVEPTRVIEVAAHSALETLARTPELSLRVMRLLAERLRAADDLAVRARP